VIVDTGDHLHLGAVEEIEAPDDVHLPQLHRSRALPALVVRARPLACFGVDEAWRTSVR
jgi:hypothetical protein